MTQPRTRGGRRGRPTVFAEPTRTRYLDLLREGARLGEAADILGISRAVPTRHAKTDREFAAAMAEAREVGAKARREDVAHGEYRYNILGCRCPRCGCAARKGRASRRAADDPPDADGVEVTPLRPVVVESSTSFLLARAS